MKVDKRLVRATERRFAEREQIRKRNQNKIKAGLLLQADSPQRVEKRLERLGVPSFAAEALVRGALDPAPSTTRTRTGLDNFALERVILKSDLMSVNYLEFGIQAARSVGCIRIQSSNQGIDGYGTGFLVSPQLLLTNHHILPSSRVSSFSQIEFNYQDGLDGQPLRSVVFNFDPDAFFLTDDRLDYTLVAIRDDPRNGSSLSSFGWNRLIEQEGKVVIGEYVSIIQHPSGKRKQLALRENQLVDVLEDFLHYRTDTAPGSSGSPVFNDQWEVVGLHHSGVPKRDFQGRILNMDGEVWSEEQGEEQVDWLANEGARISRIIKHVKQQRLSIEQKQLRNEMLEPNSNESIKSDSTSINLSPSSSNGTVTWTIPIQVSVSLGQPTIAVTDSTKNRNTYSVEPDSQPSDSLEAALAEFREASRQPYYDEVEDEQDREKYYGDLPDRVGSLKPEELYRELNDLLTQTHKNKLNYSPKSQLYPWVDLHPDLKIRSIYSGQKFEPEDLIQEDFRIDRLRTLRTQELKLKESMLTQEQYRQQINLLEASLPYNCEHVVPQSWFSKNEPMRGDLHHLFACEVACNSFRSNYPYFDFDDFEERDVIRDNCGKLSGGKFEPKKGKGETTRATLYFLLRYPGAVNKEDNEKEYGADRLETLLKWHEYFSPTEYEKHRNAAIFKKQGNRNPLIDFPEWADKIAFRLGLG
ncbi:endonuclease [Trichocoleus sp. FACHB-591]|uniref:endonuclease n=1 Tax=Trichocoleus sp. FACHB-591 TaxID=2692872 RepID=UPI00168A2A4E|nr:endonuclease [Trichocoleus sp. FACHB-591]MBD2095825.1 endonuclease [Trichocoleus sp. FACHB-591]